jgi:tRNA threonylcarbamoyl adenosine modification protein YeaZ
VSGTLLAIDLSQRVSQLALAVRGTVFARSFEGASHAEREAFWDELRALFAEAKVEPRALDALAVATGPGGFTGLRVAVAFAKSLALARSVPVVGIESARIFAASDAGRGGSGPWIVALASKSETAFVTEIAAALPDPIRASVDAVQASGRFEPAQPGAVTDAGAFGLRCRRAAAQGGALLADEHLDAVLSQVAAEAGLATRPLATDAQAFIGLAARELAAGRAIDPHALLPEYAREPEAVTKWRERAAPR